MGVNCCFRGVFFSGFAGIVKTKTGKVRNYQREAIKNTMKQVPKIKDVIFKHCSYENLDIPSNSIVYCDPPYQGVSGYKDNIDYKHFWQWCRDKTMEGHDVFISEYNAPDDFKCVWQKQMKSSLSANGTRGGSKGSIEKLFIFNG